MSAKNDGGPAFPVIGAPGAPVDYAGMSLRDWFAGMALQGWLASYASDERPVFEDVAEFVWQQADAMLEAREP